MFWKKGSKVKCEDCGKSFPSKAAYDKHMIKKSRNKNAPKVCKFC